MKTYRKTYLPLVLWVLAMLPVMIGAAMLAEHMGADGRGITTLMMVIMDLMLLILMGMIWMGGHVYWINGGPSFEEAKAAGSDVRREYAQRHFSAMLKGCAAALILMAVGYFLGVHELLLILINGVCVIVSAFSMIRIKWKVNCDDPKH